MFKSLTFLLLVASLGTAALADVKISVLKAKGKVIYNGKSIKKGDKLEPGHILDTTAAGSLAVVTYPDAPQLLFKKGKVTLNPVTKEKPAVEMISGAIYGWLRGKKNNKEFLIQTKSAVAGVRGTKFMIEEEKERTYYCVCEGEVSVTKGDKTVALKKGFDMFSYADKPMSDPVYAKKMMLERVAEAVSEMGGKTEDYWSSGDRHK